MSLDPPAIDLRLSVWAGRWAVCRLEADAVVPSWAALPARLAVVARTAEELSLIVPEHHVPPDVQIERGFRVLALKGPIPFAITGVIAAVAAPLAAAGISLFPIATYDTDFVLVKDADLDRALAALGAAGWMIDDPA